jgi:FkbM family methyltransferase
MNTFSINRAPLMTQHLVKRGTFRTEPMVVVDLGARGGANEEWKVFDDQIRLFCFEPDEAECARLATQAPPHITYIPWAIGRGAGKAKLYEAKLAASTGLYRTNMDYFGRLLNRANGVLVAEHAVELHSLDEALAAYGSPPVNFIKLDVEGAELDVLEGSPACLESPSVVGILSEIRFQPEINDSPIFSRLDAFLVPLGFRLYDLQFYHQSREALPYPGLYDYRLPSGERFFAYTTHGQIQDGDALYFRDPMIAANRDRVSALSAETLLKLCALLEIYSFNDCAAELIVAFRSHLSTKVDCDRLLDLLASGVVGGTVGYAEYRQRYFSAGAAEPEPRRANLFSRAAIRVLRRALAALERGAAIGRR